jgi:hypothetical protein
LAFSEFDLHDAAGLFSAGATGDKSEFDDRSLVLVKGVSSYCHLNLALSAKCCVSFRFLPQQPQVFPF